MNDINQGMIEVWGIDKTFPSNSKSFKQFQLQEILTIQEQNINIESILRVYAKVKINDKRFINSSTGISTGGQRLTGKKVAVVGEFIIKVDYAGYEETQSVQSTCFNIPFSTYIVVENKFEFDYETMIQPYIEYIYAKKINERKIYTNIMIILHSEHINYI